MLIAVTAALVYLIACIAVAVISTEKNRVGINWFLIALVTSPLLAAILLISAETLSKPMKTAIPPISPDDNYNPNIK